MFFVFIKLIEAKVVFSFADKLNFRVFPSKYFEVKSMKLLKIVLILTTVSLFIFACAQNATNTTSTNKTITQNVNGTTVSYEPAETNSNANKTVPAVDEFASVKKIYTEKCILCHKETGEGGQADIEGDKFKVPAFKSPGAMKADEKDFTDIIANGEEKMPSFKKQLKPEEIAGLVKYIRKEFQGR